MPIKRQKWEPDTFPGDYFIIEYDTANYDGTHSCDTARVDGVDLVGAQAQAAYASKLASTQKKNYALFELWQALPAALREEILSDGQPTGKFQPKPGVVVDWQRTGENSYVFKCTALTNAQVTAANTWLANKGYTGVTVTNG